jgi:hypothetical protein
MYRMAASIASAVEAFVSRCCFSAAAVASSRSLLPLFLSRPFCFLSLSLLLVSVAAAFYLFLLLPMPLILLTLSLLLLSLRLSRPAPWKISLSFVLSLVLVLILYQRVHKGQGGGSSSSNNGAACSRSGPPRAPHRLRFPLHLAPGPSFVAVVASLHIYIHYACRYLSTFITHIDTNRRSFTYQ